MLDVIVIGAGAAGLRVAGELKRTGYSVALLEASDRVGGRIRTIYDSNVGVPLELGAEFVHGAATETYKLLDAARLATVSVLGEHYRSRAGEFESQDKVWKRMNRVFKRMDADRKSDRSFQEFLATKPGGPLLREERELARAFVQGFNAANASLISEKSLAEQGDPTEAAATAARVVNGYGALVDYLKQDLDDVVQFNSLVQRVAWEENHVRVLTRDAREFEARAAVITIPLPMLQDESVAFEPEVMDIRNAARLLVMGDVARVNVVVRKRFWEDRLDELSFLHTPDRPFNVWWTLNPLRAPVIVGWAGGPPAHDLLEADDVEATALRELGRAFGMRRKRLEPLIETVHTWDWTEDPHARGAYTYVGVGGTKAAGRLTRPIRNTLFFAGEATDAQNMGTVEGALASGSRAFRQVVKALR